LAIARQRAVFRGVRAQLVQYKPERQRYPTHKSVGGSISIFIVLL
jgi:hypothetical protein